MIYNAQVSLCNHDQFNRPCIRTTRFVYPQTNRTRVILNTNDTDNESRMLAPCKHTAYYLSVHPIHEKLLDSENILANPVSVLWTVARDNSTEHNLCLLKVQMQIDFPRLITSAHLHDTDAVHSILYCHKIYISGHTTDKRM